MKETSRIKCEICEGQIRVQPWKEGIERKLCLKCLTKIRVMNGIMRNWDAKERGKAFAFYAGQKALEENLNL